MADSENAELEPSSSKNFFARELQDRGRVKHEILKRYLNAWFPIMAQGFGSKDVIYVDGFAGPGKYKNDVEGSPLLAYNIATQHKLEEKFKGNIKLIFVELKKEYFEQLEHNLKNASEYHGTHVTYKVHHGAFAKVLEKILEENPAEKSNMLVFADPFGYSGSTMPMSLLQKVMDRPYSEVFINVMDGKANRWFTSEKHQGTITKLIGTSDWMESVCAVLGIDTHEKLERFMKIYIQQLCRGRECLSLKFAMKDEKNSHIYHLLFVTKHIKGIIEMKTSMWEQSQTDEDYSFSEWTMGKQDIPDPKKNEDEIVQDVVARIKEKFGCRETVTGEEIEFYIWMETPYVFNFKVNLKKALKPYVLQGIRASSAFKKLVFDIPRE